MIKELFPVRTKLNPTIYAYFDTNPQYVGLLKIGYTTIGAKNRVAQQYPTMKPGALPYELVLEESAMGNDGSSFTDRDIHRYLKKAGVKHKAGEWFECTVNQVKAAIIALKSGNLNEDNRSLDFEMRPEQLSAVNKTISYFKSFLEENDKTPPHFLWNAKMRFGKTFAAYQLAKKMGWKRLLILTFKPAVQSAWEEDLTLHKDFAGWQFVCRNGLTFNQANKENPIVCFGSFQDYLGKNPLGGIKPQNEWVHLINWDCVVFDEYHYGAWKERAKGLFEIENENELDFIDEQQLEYFDEGIMPITTGAYLYLSGTPFRAISSGEFIEEQIFNWTYTDEQFAKNNWTGENNPYLSLPRMVMMTYQLPDSIREIALKGEFNEFDLNIFFSASGNGKSAKFKNENQVQKWLDIIQGTLKETRVDNLKLGTNKPPMPFSDVRLLNVLSHTFWLLPNVASCYAMENLLRQRQNDFYQKYKIIVAAGNGAGIGAAALPPILKAMEAPLESKTITLSCSKLTTGVSVKPWTGILMLCNILSPESYFQAAFRVQTPWTIKNPDRVSPNRIEIIKKECYVFDFAPNRALKLIADYGCRLNLDETNPELKIQEFIHFLPVLAYDGSSMTEIDAAGILDIASSGTTATLLARRWESALLVNVDNNTLLRLMNNSDAMDALRSIEGFRTLNQDIEIIINKSQSVKTTKMEANYREISEEEKKELSDSEKKYKSLRKQIQEKLIKFATRIPVFMYLTDYRERSLKDIITQLEPGLFKKVTGLTVKDFELLVSLGVFNSNLMNDAVFKFKRYEDASLSYVGVNKHEGDPIGGYDTVISLKDYTTYQNLE